MSRAVLALALGFLAHGCTAPQPTEVLVHVDAHPESARLTSAVRLRVWGGPPFGSAPFHDRTIVLVPPDGGTAVAFPITIPLVPMAGDPSRRFVVEVQLLADTGDMINWARVEGTYVAETPREVTVCVEDPCLDRRCPLSEACITDADTACDTCRSGACQPAEVAFVPRGTGPGRCPPPPVCSPAMEPESTCDNGMDDDCDFRPDCLDPDCNGRPCGPTGTCGGESGPDCVDGSDDDCDGLVDCADPDCTGLDAEITNILCVDGLDNDCNSLVDCADPNCRAFVIPEATHALCADGGDNDCDGFADCDDEGCRVLAEICDDGIDNDCDGLADCADDACTDWRAEQCFNLIDDDCDGLRDCDDEECRGIDVEFGEFCMDGRDNDCDSNVDCDDPGCLNWRPERCTGGIDEDCDGFADCDDADCRARTEICGNGVDDDCDGLADCADMDCVVPEVCGDFRDNDCDGLVDCADLYDCCSSGNCQGQAVRGNTRLRCCDGTVVDTSSDEQHCGACNTQCGGGFNCFAHWLTGAGYCNCTSASPYCPRGQTCVNNFTPGAPDGDAYRCSCRSDAECGAPTEPFVCQRNMGTHNTCEPTIPPP